MSSSREHPNPVTPAPAGYLLVWRLMPLHWAARFSLDPGAHAPPVLPHLVPADGTGGFRIGGLAAGILLGWAEIARFGWSGAPRRPPGGPDADRGPEPGAGERRPPGVAPPRSGRVPGAGDPDLLREAKVLAARRGTSVTALLAEQLERLVREDQDYEQARERALARPSAWFDLRWQRPETRDELYER